MNVVVVYNELWFLTLFFWNNFIHLDLFFSLSSFSSFSSLSSLLSLSSIPSLSSFLLKKISEFIFTDLYVLATMIDSQTLMTVRSFTLASVMVSPGWVFVQERLSSTMPQVFVMIQILFQDGKNLQLRVFFLLMLFQLNFIYLQRKFLERQRKGRTARLLRLRLLISYHQQN